MKDRDLQVLQNNISRIREENDTQKRLAMLLNLNGSLREDLRLQMPSLITNAYVRRAIDLIDERISLLAMGMNTMSSSAA